MKKSVCTKYPWIGKIPDNWELKRVKYVYNGQTGFTPDTAISDYYDDQSNNVWISIGDMNEKTVYDSNTKISDLYIKKFNPKIVKKGSLLYSFKLSVGKTAFAGKDLYTNEAIECFCEDKNVCLPFLYYASFLIEHNANVNIYGAKIMNQQLIADSMTIVPPLSEQKQIALFLDNKIDKVDKTIELTQNQIETLEKKKKHIIEEAVSTGVNRKHAYINSRLDWINKIPKGWTISKFKYVFDIKRGLDITKDDLVDCGNKVISYGQIHSKENPGTKLTNDLFRYVDDTFLSDNESLVNKYDFIFADTSEDLEGCGNCAYIDSQDTIFAGYHTIIASPKKKNDMRYFAYLFKTDFWRSQIRSKVWAVKLYSITQKILKETELIIPGAEEQKIIADYLDEKINRIDKIICVKTKELDVLREYKKSIVYEYITGKKRVDLCQSELTN